MRKLLAVALAAALVPTFQGTAAVRAQSQVANDINGDGYGDLLVGVPLENVGSRSDAGIVHVIYSDGSRLAAAGNMVVGQAGPLPGPVEADDLFGSAVELADINGDDYADAIIGSSGETIGLEVNAGLFHTILGGAGGLDLSTAVAYRQGAGLPDVSELNDFFGFNISSGDFDDDGYDDVVVSAPFEDIGDAVDAGAIMVVPGGASGLDTSRARLFSQAGPVAGAAESRDFFGWSLTTGDFDADTYDDLAVGVPGEDRGTIVDSGAVNVLYGSAAGLTTTGNRSFSQAGPVVNRPEDNADGGDPFGDFFGFAVAASDMNCDGVDDLLVGVPNEVLGDGVVAGLVNVLLGSDEGLTPTGNVALAQGRRGVAGVRDFNQFGAALAAGNFDDDECGDIAIGAHTTDIGGDGSRLCVEDPDCASEAGAVVIVYGSPACPKIGGTALFSQRGPIGGVAQEGDFFGRTLAVVDADGNGRHELVIGVPREDRGARVDVGKITVLKSRPSGLTTRGDYSLSQAGPILDKPEARDQFSSSMLAATS